MKFIKGYENLYSIAEDGNIYSHPRKGSGGHHGKWLLPCKGTNGYLYITLCKNIKKKKFSIHYLVANTFLVNFLNKPQINHKDGNRMNNCVSNLEFVTASENGLHSYEYLNRKPTCAMKGKIGRKHNKSKWFFIKYPDGRIIKYESGGEFTRLTGLSRESVSYCRQLGHKDHIFIKGRMRGFTVYFYKPEHKWEIDDV